MDAFKNLLNIVNQSTLVVDIVKLLNDENVKKILLNQSKITP